MADDIRSRAGLDPREEAARRIRDGEARRAAAREALTQEQMRERTMREMEQRRAAPPRPAAEAPAAPRPSVSQRIQAEALRPPSSSPAAQASRARMAGGAVGAGLALGVGLDQARRQGVFGERLANINTRERPVTSRGRSMMDAEGSEIAADAERVRQDASYTPPAPPAPRPAPARRPAAAAPREISADRLNDLMMGAEPTTAEERVAQMRMRGRQQELEERGTAFRKGGMVKPKAKPVAKKTGGMIAAKPKKMMKGGVVAKPKSKSKPMPAFKKGGVVKKGKK